MCFVILRFRFALENWRSLHHMILKRVVVFMDKSYPFLPFNFHE